MRAAAERPSGGLKTVSPATDRSAEMSSVAWWKVEKKPIEIPECVASILTGTCG